MIKHKSLSFGDFSLRGIPGFTMIYVVISIFSIGLGLALEALPKFWAGVLCEAGLGLLGALVLLNRGKKEIDLAALPEPSAHVQAICEDYVCLCTVVTKERRL